MSEIKWPPKKRSPKDDPEFDAIHDAYIEKDHRCNLYKVELQHFYNFLNSRTTPPTPDLKRVRGALESLILTARVMQQQISREHALRQRNALSEISFQDAEPSIAQAERALKILDAMGDSK